MASRLWMRWVDFSKLRDLLVLVAQNNGQLRAKDLHEIGTREGILITARGRPFSVTTTYHYRRTLERLDLVNVVHARYSVNDRNRLAVDLLDKAHSAHPLTQEERSVFGSIVLRNADCYEAFFQAFVPEMVQPTTASDFVLQGGTVALEANTSSPKSSAKNGASVKLTSLRTGDDFTYRGEDALQAVIWGVRLWSTEQLRFIDEVLRSDSTHVLYPVDSAARPEEAVGRVLVGLLALEEEWESIRVPDFILRAGEEAKLPSAEVKRGLKWLHKRFPGYVAPVATSEQFIARSYHSAQRRAALANYVQLPSGENISHFQINRGIRRLMAEEVTK
jgi:hypothetical protein